MQIKQAYHNAFPHPGTCLPWVNLHHIQDLSLYLQQVQWLTGLYGQQFPGMECQAPTFVHKPHAAVLLLERTTQRPQPGQGGYFKIPILICEVEGGKDIWGAMKQEAKAMEEVVNTLTFMEQNYCLFIYNNRWEFWKAKRMEVTSTVDITCETIWVQTGTGIGYGNKLQRIVSLILFCINQTTYRWSRNNVNANCGLQNARYFAPI